MSAIDLCKLLPGLKSDPNYSFLKEVSSAALQQSIRNMDQAFTKFFREHAGFPKFKSKKSSRNSYKEVQGCAVDLENNKIKLPKVGWVRFYANQIFEGKIGTVTISKTPTGKYFVSILVDNGAALRTNPCTIRQPKISIYVPAFAQFRAGIEPPYPNQVPSVPVRLVLQHPEKLAP